MQISPEFEAILEEKKRQQQERLPKSNIAIGVGQQVDGKRMVAQGICRANELQEHIAYSNAELEVMAEQAKEACRKYQEGRRVR